MFPEVLLSTIRILKFPGANAPVFLFELCILGAEPPKPVGNAYPASKQPYRLSDGGFADFSAGEMSRTGEMSTAKNQPRLSDKRNAGVRTPS